MKNFISVQMYMTAIHLEIEALLFLNLVMQTILYLQIYNLELILLE